MNISKVLAYACVNNIKYFRYRKNEVFLDVIESVNLLAGASGNVLRSVFGDTSRYWYLSIWHLAPIINFKVKGAPNLVLFA